MDGKLDRLGEILLLIYMLLGFAYMGWWGYMLITRPDLVEKWRNARPRWVQRLMLIKKLPRFIEFLVGMMLMSFSLIFLLFVCFLLIRSLLRIGG